MLGEPSPPTVVRIDTSPTTAITASSAAPVSKLHPGDGVTALGTNENGTAAARVTDSGSSTASGGNGRSGGGNGRGERLEARSQPHTSAAVSTTSRSFAISSSRVIRFPSTVEEKPHCGERQSWSSGM